MIWYHKYRSIPFPSSPVSILPGSDVSAPLSLTESTLDDDVFERRQIIIVKIFRLCFAIEEGSRIVFWE